MAATTTGFGLLQFAEDSLPFALFRTLTRFPARDAGAKNVPTSKPGGANHNAQLASQENPQNESKC